MPGEDRERVFTRLARGRHAGGTEGAGLGLPIVAAIADAHGGRVDLESAPGVGATFAVVLPRPQAPAADDDGAAPGEDAFDLVDPSAETMEIPVRVPGRQEGTR